MNNQTRWAARKSVRSNAGNQLFNAFRFDDEKWVECEWEPTHSMEVALSRAEILNVQSGATPLDNGNNDSDEESKRHGGAW